jgi:chaperonin GroES
MSKLNPLHDNVIVKREKSEEKTPGGLLIPTTAAEKSTFAEVLAVGKGIITDAGVLIPVGVKPGQKVLLKKNRGVEVTVEAETYLIVKEDDILGVIEG